MSVDIALEEGDIVIANTGDLTTVGDLDKLIQDLRKAVLTNLGSNKYHIDYGCTIGADTIGLDLPDWMIQNEATSSITNTLNMLKISQSQQRRSQDVTGGEMLLSITDITVTRDSTEPRQVNIVVSVVTEAFSTADVGFTITP